ncbi:hypothetical protein GGQ68_000703 [Sagittula marina]|uniref:Heme NO-binding domain-containing protein n=1 Tax=Sagittula marina TaxID=943940 RepID=A0A7W6DP81_9RHOB|nr:hypothetical protein [Sagittula marina]
MKGIVFTELLTMAEQTVGEEALDEVLDQLALASGGAYSRVGNYPCSELVAIVGALSARTGMSGEDLQRAFGCWMLDRFKVFYPHFFEGKASSLEMLAAIENEVHVEVRKLYPDAELPRFETAWDGPRRLRMRYVSERPLVAFCEGLIRACADAFGDKVSVEVSRDSDREATFDITMIEIAGQWTDVSHGAEDTPREPGAGIA